MGIHMFAGILVGYFNANNSMVLIAALLWGVVFCSFMLKQYKGRKEQYMQMLKSRGKETDFGLPPRIGFYVREYAQAVSISFAIGAIVQLLK